MELIFIVLAMFLLGLFAGRLIRNFFMDKTVWNFVYMTLATATVIAVWITI